MNTMNIEYEYNTMQLIRVVNMNIYIAKKLFKLPIKFKFRNHIYIIIVNDSRTNNILSLCVQNSFNLLSLEMISHPIIFDAHHPPPPTTAIFGWVE